MVALSEFQFRFFGERSVRVAFASLLCGATLLIAMFEGAASAADRPKYKDPHAAINERVEDLLARMTLEEKVAQMRAIWENKTEVFDSRLELDAAKMARLYPDGVGQFARPND